MDKIGLILMFTWKFALTFPIAIYINKLSFIQTILWANVGGILGVLIFTYLSDYIILAWKKHFTKQNKTSKKGKAVFNKRNRRIVWIKLKYGLPGIVILNPVVLSIPVGTFLIRKYYGRKIINLVWLVFGQLVWSFIYTYFYFFIKINV